MRKRSYLGAGVLLAALGCSDNAAPPTEPTTATESPVTAAATSNTWSTRANMPSDRWFVTTATFPTGTGAASLYAIGGGDKNGKGPVGTVQVYNPASNTWSTKASLLHWVTALASNGAQVINGLVYVPGGMRNWNSYDYLQVYNPATNKWVDKARIPPFPPYNFTGLALGASGAINGKLYVAGVCLILGDRCGKAFLRYDPATNKWTHLPLPHTDPAWLVGGVLNQKFYITDGHALEVYDPVANKWTLKASVPAPRTIYEGAAAVNNKLYLVGGTTITQPPTFTPRVLVYDPGTNTWTRKTDLPRAEFGLMAGRVVVNGQARLEVVGGARPGNNLQYTP